MISKFIHYFRFSSIIILLFIVSIGYSQSIQDIQNLKVDELSDAQIEQLIKRAESSGMNEMQLEAMARERGMPASEVAKLRQRIESLKSGNSEVTAGKSTGRNNQREVVDAEMQQNVFDSLRQSDPYYDLSPQQKKIFGYTLFHNQELNFNPNLNIPTPENYILGTGDQVLVDVYGASQAAFDMTVSPEGKILIPNIGPINIGGASVESARLRVKNALGQIYSGLKGPNPNTFLQLRVGNIRSIQVTMAGELNKPGTYTLPSFANVFNALYLAGGPNEIGSFRNIQVYRDSKSVGQVDVYDFLVNGNQKGNIVLQDNDVVIVPPIQTRVELEGPVRRPGLFEVKGDENIHDLLTFAGGFKSEAYKELVTVKRTTDQNLRVDNIFNKDFDSFSIKDGDLFVVGSILERYDNRVQVSGAVFRPGEFAISDEMTVQSLIELAGGLRGDAFSERATLYRTNPDFTMEVLTLDLGAIISGNAVDVPLMREDILSIPSKYDLKEEYYVQISGEVNRTGVFQYAKNMTVGDLITKASGFKESASSANIEIARRVKGEVGGEIAKIFTVSIDEDLKITEAEREIILEPFDHVFVRKSPGFQEEKIVYVEGEVFYPGGFTLEKRDERISDVLKRAGGLNNYAYPKGATLIRRTEFFKTKTEENIKLEQLESLHRNIIREDEIENAEAEGKLLERIDDRMALLLHEERKTNEELKQSDSISEDKYQFLGEEDSTVMEVATRDKELIGIDLMKILSQPGSKYDLILQEGDVISIPKELQTVRMRGEVLYPTTARYDMSRGFRNYISRAGGFTEQARKSRAYVVYANGDVHRTNKFLFFNFFPKIEPGAEIIVPQKPKREPMSVQAWIGIASSLATLGILIDRISN
ncbi:SLBB domain-containing protein [Cyclobacterium marinum]|uniref:Soluble ligand binding domain-containing protein n=1 Tax=Cyclobacterium marinum (strain ATCC 25205 / DSM 745 / LMG 13164 / NCIMB 1802) TaxID=880070 RepID=G0J0Q4_CYCMS|nr:SLBB domain-containing protein [Cyclobacterium marinum]AEL24466.1 Soluble ligand binding domain-containing protein [Cyclobacterium marinum DSM 745]